MLPSPGNCCSGACVGLGACSGTGESHVGKGSEEGHGVLLLAAVPSLEHCGGDQRQIASLLEEVDALRQRTIEDETDLETSTSDASRPNSS